MNAEEGGRYRDAGEENDEKVDTDDLWWQR